MRSVIWTAFLSDTDLQLLAFPLYGGEPLHQRRWRTATTLARQHRERTMVGSVTSIHRCEEPLSVQGICATYCAGLARALSRKHDGCVTRAAEYILRGLPAIRICRDNYLAVCL